MTSVRIGKARDTVATNEKGFPIAQEAPLSVRSMIKP